MRFLTQLPRRGVVSCSCSCSYYLLFLCRYGETQCYALLLCTYIDTLYIVGSLCPIYNIYIPCHIRYECSTVQFFFFYIYHIFFAMGGPEGGPHYYYYSLRQLFPGG